MDSRVLPLACGVIVLGVAGSIPIARWLTDLRSGPVADCVESVDLQARSKRGWPWSEHRHWLEMPSLLQGNARDFVVHNLRTGETFRWPARPDEARGRTRFPVLTRYAEFRNRNWRDDPWSLCRLRVPSSVPGVAAPAAPRRRAYAACFAS